MNEDFAMAMRRALEHTRAGDVLTATNIIQTAIAQKTRNTAAYNAPPDDPQPPPRPHRPRPPIDRNAEVAVIIETEPEAKSVPEPIDTGNRDEDADADATPGAPAFQTTAHRRRHLARKPWTSKDRGAKFGLRGGWADSRPTAKREPSPSPETPGGAQFLERSFTCAEGTRKYKLFVPARTPADASDNPRGLIVMLHGCSQTPDDFALGTNMNDVARGHGLLVAYPAQTAADNFGSCWNWFRPGDQARDAGEPAIIAGITRAIASEYGLERDRIFVAGLSSGGAMAAVMAETYPDLYAAVGIHSGVAYGSAKDLMSAYAVMRGSGAPRARPGSPAVDGSVGKPRTIVFHGSADQTVHPSNAERIAAAARASVAAGETRSERQTSDAGRAYTRSVVHGADGIPHIEYWLIDRTGHAWSGGRRDGSFTDPDGPDASAEMVRFFLQGACADNR